MADQMKPSALEVGHQRSLLLHLLHVVFAEFAQSQPICVADSIGAEYFGYREQANRSAIPSGPHAGIGDPISNSG